MGNLQVLPTIIEKVTPLVKTLVKWIQNKNAQNDIQQLIDNGQQETLKMLVQINQQHNANTKKLFQIMQQWQTKARTPEEFHSIHEHIEDQFVKSISTLTLPRAIQANNLKNYALFGPTSVGKTSILNAVFSLNLPVGLGACTKDIQPVTIVGQVLYWDVPGINKNFNLYKLPYLAFFNDLDKVFILFSSDIQSVSLLLKVCWVMKKQIVLVRTKCDQWLNCSKTVAQELENDLKEARRYYPSCNQVIPVGYGRYNAIKPELQ